MCGSVTNEQYRRGYYGAKIVGEYTKPGKDNALLIEDSVGEVSINLTPDGQEYIYFHTNGEDWLTTAQQLERNRAWLAANDYTLTAEPIKKPRKTKGVTGVGIQLLAEDEAMSLPDETDLTTIFGGGLADPVASAFDSDVVVQGRTIREWARIGDENEDTEEHIHPEFPEGHEPTEDEQKAYIASMTGIEAYSALMRTDPSTALALALDGYPSPRVRGLW